MTQFILKINLGNDAMRSIPHIISALKNTCTVLSGIDSIQDAKKYGQRKIIDVNGNSVGYWQIKPDKDNQDPIMECE
jgi:hypothetical protein